MDESEDQIDIEIADFYDETSRFQRVKDLISAIKEEYGWKALALSIRHPYRTYLYFQNRELELKLESLKRKNRRLEFDKTRSS